MELTLHRRDPSTFLEFALARGKPLPADPNEAGRGPT
jgi:hypothetical protein